MRKTTHEIIDEIAAHYNLGNRSIMGEKALVDGKMVDLCVYNGIDRRHCAFAYMMIDPSIIKKEDEKNTCYVIIDHYAYSDADLILKEEFRGYDTKFYRSIQMLHDQEEHWTNEGLSELGKEYVKQIKIDYPSSTPHD